jgi:hypothetical protein
VFRSALAGFAVTALTLPAAHAQSSAELAKQLANPIIS